VISYAVPPKEDQIKRGGGFHIVSMFQTFRACASELRVNSGSWGLVANCFNVRGVAVTLRVSPNLGSDCRVGFSFLEAVSEFCSPFPAMAIS
jgi:hypothetical protein